MKDKKGYCLVSQQIREKILSREIKISESDLSINSKGAFNNADIESRIQPSSFEPIVSDEAFILDCEEQVVFGPKQNETVYRALLKLPRRQRQKINIAGGFELKTGFTYLIPLEERLVLHEGERIKASPKSSIGRLFPLVRMIGDYNPGFNELHYQSKKDELLQTWLLVQPTAFNLIISPGISLNQLRFLNGLDVSLSQQEIIKEFERTPLLYLKKDGKEVPACPIITDDGLKINFDLTGEHTEGIVALRARKNPTPIDLSKKKVNDAEEFFEPVEGKQGQVKLIGREKYLIASKGVLYTPSHLSSELRRHYGSGMRGTWDEAGFVDPGFTGDLVFEVCISERGGVTLSQNDERQVSALEFFRTNQEPDKLYGERKTGSNYQGQLGPRISKHFKNFDFKWAARNYQKLDREVLVHDAKILKSFRKTNGDFELLESSVAEKLKTKIERQGFFHSRYDCESDEEVLQVIPYVLLFDESKKIFTYIRASDIKDYGDERLFGKHSIGFGGHINTEDKPEYLQGGLEREIREEVRIDGGYSQPRLVGTLVADDAPVDRVHFGLIYTAHINGIIKPNEKAITSIGMKSFEGLAQNPAPFETWSKILIPRLSELYEK